MRNTAALKESSAFWLWWENSSFDRIKMITSFSVQYLGEMLPKLSKNMADINFSSPDPILKELNVSSIEEAISIFATELERFSKNNFHPIAAQLTYILAICYKLENDQSKYLEFLTYCLSKNYQKFTPKTVENTWKSEIESMDKTVLNLFDFSVSPFLAKASFLSGNILPSTDMFAHVTLTTCLPQEFEINKISLVVKAPDVSSIKVTVFENVKIDSKHSLKKKFIVGKEKPGLYFMDSLILYINKVQYVLHFPTKNSIEVMPYESDTTYSVSYGKIPITKIPFTVKAICGNIPPESSKVTIHGEIVGDAIFTSNNDRMADFSLDNPGNDAEISFDVYSQAKASSKVNILFDILHDDNRIKHSESIVLDFHDVFSHDYTIFGPDRMPFSNRKSPVIKRGTEYAFLTTFEYNLIHKCEILEIEAKAREGFKLSTMPFELPIEVTLNEAFKFACFITADHNNSKDNVVPASLYLRIKIGDDPQELDYQWDLPRVSFENTDFDVQLDIPSEVKVGEETEINVDVISSSETQEQLTLNVDESPFYDVKEKKQDVVLDNGKCNLKLHFIPKERSTRTFPLISLTSNEKTLWQSKPFITPI